MHNDMWGFDEPYETIGKVLPNGQINYYNKDLRCDMCESYIKEGDRVWIPSQSNKIFRVKKNEQNDSDFPYCLKTENGPILLREDGTTEHSKNREVHLVTHSNYKKLEYLYDELKLERPNEANENLVKKLLENGKVLCYVSNEREEDIWEDFFDIEIIEKSIGDYFYDVKGYRHRNVFPINKETLELLEID